MPEGYPACGPQGLVCVEARPHGAIPVRAFKARLGPLDIAASETIVIRCVLVHAIDEEAAAFYKRYQFVECPIGSTGCRAPLTGRLLGKLRQYKPLKLFF